MCRAIERVKNGETFREAAKAEGVSMTTLHSHVTAAGVPVRSVGRQAKPYRENVREAVALVRAGETYRHAQSVTGVPISVISKWNKRGVPA